MLRRVSVCYRRVMRRPDMNSPKRYRIEKMLWYVQIPLALLLYTFDRHVWVQISILYLAILSIWALGSTADGNEEAAKARELAENLDVK